MEDFCGIICWLFVDIRWNIIGSNPPWCSHPSPLFILPIFEPLAHIYPLLVNCKHIPISGSRAFWSNSGIRIWDVLDPEGIVVMTSVLLKIAQEKDGYQRQSYRFHVHWSIPYTCTFWFRYGLEYFFSDLFLNCYLWTETLSKWIKSMYNLSK